MNTAVHSTLWPKRCSRGKRWTNRRSTASPDFRPLPSLRPESCPSKRIHAIEVERLDPKPLNVRVTDPKRVEVNSLHLSVDSFWLSKRHSTESLRLSRRSVVFRCMAGQSRTHGGPAVAPRLHNTLPLSVVHRI